MPLTLTLICRVVSGYPLMSWLLTSFSNPQTEAQQCYNEAHVHTRVVFVRSIGLLKSRWRWRCLNKSGGILLYTPENVCAIMAQRHRIPAPAPILPDEMDAHAAKEDHAPRAVDLRKQVMQRLWTGKTQNILFQIFYCTTNVR